MVRVPVARSRRTLSGDSTSSETSFSMIGVDDLLGRHGINLPDSVYIVNILSDQGWHAAGCVLRRPAVHFIEPDNSPGNATGGYRNSDGASIPVQQAPADYQPPGTEWRRTPHGVDDGCRSVMRLRRLCRTKIPQCAQRFARGTWTSRSSNLAWAKLKHLFGKSAAELHRWGTASAVAKCLIINRSCYIVPPHARTSCAIRESR